MISHANIMWTIRSAAPVVHVQDRERFLSFLPLSHIAERMMPPDGVLRGAAGVAEAPRRRAVQVG
jgi:long-subunit acyl-CoA synthetase (AMP-forming)